MSRYPKAENLARDEEARQRHIKDYMDHQHGEEFRDKQRAATQSSYDHMKASPVTSVEKEREREREEEIRKHLTWRQNIPILCHYEYYEQRANTYPYIRRSEQYDDSMIRGVSMTPRLSEYPMCRDIIRDYYRCRDDHRLQGWFNLCSPLKEQLIACINEVFVKNHKRGDKKFNDNRDEYFEKNRERKLQKMLDYTRSSQEKREKLAD